MKDTDETAFLNSLFMDFTSENELELFLKSLDEVWSEDLYSRLSAAGLIRHVISKVWNKEQHRISMVFEYDSKEGYQKCQEIIDQEFSVILKEKLKKFVFKIHNNRGVVVSEFISYTSKNVKFIAKQF